MDWYKNYNLVKEKEGYTVVINLNLNSNSTEFSSEFIENVKKNTLNLDHEIRKLVEQNFSKVKINSIKLMLGTAMIASIPFAVHTKVQAADSIITLNSSGVVTSTSLNVRGGASVNDPIIFKLYQDNQVNIIGESGDWYEIKLTDGRIGWVSSLYIKLDTTQQSTIESMNAVGVVAIASLNVRSGASTNDAIISKLYQDNKVNIIGKSGDWYEIKLADGNIGWVSSLYIKLDTTQQSTIESINTTGTVTASSLNVRSGPSANDTVISKLYQGNTANIIGKSGDWYEVKLQDGRTGWVSSAYIQIDLRQEKINMVISTAKSLLGTPYVWGGESLAEGGFDCSGFVYYVFKQAGYDLSRVSKDQAEQGTEVSRTNLQPGDLVFFSFAQNGIVDHVGIYIGNGQMIHSPKTGDVVKIADITTSYWQTRFVIAKRII